MCLRGWGGARDEVRVATGGLGGKGEERDLPLECGGGRVGEEMKRGSRKGWRVGGKGGGQPDEELEQEHPQLPPRARGVGTGGRPAGRRAKGGRRGVGVGWSGVGGGGAEVFGGGRRSLQHRARGGAGPSGADGRLAGERPRRERM